MVESAMSALEPPDKLLSAHRRLLTALRLESGYSPGDLLRLINPVLTQYAHYVHALPATRAEHHREPGGLLRFALETAHLAFRRADGRIFVHSSTTETANRKERVWRYAAFLGALCAPLGRIATALVVQDEAGRDVWNPYQQPLWDWVSENHLRRYVVTWRSATDRRPKAAATVWLTSRLLSNEVMTFLQERDSASLEALLAVLNGAADEPLGALVHEAQQAIIDQDLAASLAQGGVAVAGVSVEHTLLECLRKLAREQWTLNTPGGRIWVTPQGTYLAWQAVVQDLALCLRAKGVVGIPTEPDTLAELLEAKGILTPALERTTKSPYHRVRVLAPGVPRQALAMVRLADPDSIGLKTQTVVPVELEYVAKDIGQEGHLTSTQPTAGGQIELPLASLDDTQTLEGEGGALKEALETHPVQHRTQLPTSSASSLSEPRAKTAELESTPVDRLKALDRYGVAGQVLRCLAERLREGKAEGTVFDHPEGVAIEYPGAISPFIDNPQAFLEACRAQNLVVGEGERHTQLVRQARGKDPKRPAQYIVLTKRIGELIRLPESGDG